MNKEQLFYFVKVIECGSINKAAEQLFISQPSLSRAIHSLEEELGKDLITRHNKGISITPAGKTMYYYAQSIVGQFQMIEKLKQLPNEKLHSNLSVSISNIFLRDDLIFNFYQRISAADTEINLYETTTEEMLNDVLKRKSEIGITVLNTTQFEIFQRVCELKGIEIEIIGKSPLYIHTNQGVFSDHLDYIQATELMDKTFVHLPNDFYSNLNLSLDVDDVRINSFSKNITLSNYHTIIKILKNVDTFLLGHKWQVHELSQTDIKSYLIKNNDIEKLFIIVKNKKETFSSAGKIFVDIIKEFYSSI